MSKLEIWKVFAGGATVIGVFVAGFQTGAYIEAKSVERQIADFAQQASSEITGLESGRSAVGEALAAGDIEAATNLLKDGATLYPEDTCVAHGRSVDLKKGGTVVSCETGMRAVLASLNSTYATFTVGSRQDSGYPGHVFKADGGRFPDCKLIYEADLTQDDMPTAKVSFDCPASGDGQ